MFRLEEFTKLLREETEVRLSLVGPWAAEVVSVENRFRLQGWCRDSCSRSVLLGAEYSVLWAGRVLDVNYDGEGRRTACLWAFVVLVRR